MLRSEVSQLCISPFEVSKSKIIRSARLGNDDKVASRERVVDVDELDHLESDSACVEEETGKRCVDHEEGTLGLVCVCLCVFCSKE